MEDEFDKIKKAVENIRLSFAEKEQMRANILRSANSGVQSPYFARSHFFAILRTHRFVPALLLALLIILGGGSVVFAEKAVPGDWLYGVKTMVNEPVAGILALTKTKKIKWEKKLIERRMDEEKTLISQNRLDEKKKNYLENRIKKSREKIDRVNKK